MTILRLCTKGLDGCTACNQSKPTNCETDVSTSTLIRAMRGFIFHFQYEFLYKRNWKLNWKKKHEWNVRKLPRNFINNKYTEKSIHAWIFRMVPIFGGENKGEMKHIHLNHLNLMYTAFIYIYVYSFKYVFFILSYVLNKI